MIIDTMKADRLQYRKARDTENTKFLTVFLGDLENEQLRGVKVDDELKEAELLEKYLPKQLTTDELSDSIDHIIEQHGFDSIGPIMGKLKQLHGTSYDGKVASQLVKEKLV